MSFSRPIQWYHSHADPVWPDSTFNSRFSRKFKCFAVPLICDVSTIPPVSWICRKISLER